MTDNNITQRNIALWIVLSLVTCGIAGLVWLYQLSEDMRRAASPDDFTLDSGVIVLLGALFIPFLWYWSYKQGERIDRIHHIENGNKNVLFLLLSIFGFTIVVYALIQDELNKLAIIPQNPYEA